MRRLTRLVFITMAVAAAVPLGWQPIWLMPHVAGLSAASESNPTSVAPVNLADLRVTNELGEPVLLGKTVTVEGVAVVDTGRWHNAANYFAIVGPEPPSAAHGAGPNGLASERLYGALVYLPGTTRPEVRAGDLVRVTGKVSVRGYTTDYGTTVVIPSKSEDITILERNHPLGTLTMGATLPTDPAYSEAEPLEGQLVTVEGRLSRYDNDGITRGFWVDGSRDGNTEDGKGKMQVKFYDYAGVDITGLKNGDWVVVTGVLVQGDDAPPYNSFYYLRPTKQADIRSDASRALGTAGGDEIDTDMSYHVAQPVHMPDKGIYQLSCLVSGSSYPFLDQLYPDWKPDGSAVVFTLGKMKSARTTQETADLNLFLLKFTGQTEVSQVTFDRNPKAFPRWSPDGRRVAYSSGVNLDDAQGNWDIWVWDLDKENKPIRVTTDSSYDTTPAWSPDGQSIAFRSNRAGNWDLWRVDLSRTSSPARLTDSPADEGYPDWSPDGSMIAYQSDCSGTFNIWVLHLNERDEGLSQCCLTGSLSGNSVYPRWSPDGSKIAFMSNHYGTWDIWIVHVPSGRLQRITDLDGDEKYPAWSPDGRRILFASDAGQGWNLYVADLQKIARMRTDKPDETGGAASIGAEYPSEAEWNAAAPGAAPEGFNCGKVVSSEPGFEQEVARALGANRTSSRHSDIPDQNGAAGINRIVSPLLTQPAFVRPGDAISVKVLVPERTTGTAGWQARLSVQGGTLACLDCQQVPRDANRRDEGPDGNDKQAFGAFPEDATVLYEVPLSVEQVTQEDDGYWRIKARVPYCTPLELYDLIVTVSIDGGKVITDRQPNAVKVVRDGVQDAFRFAILSDVHLNNEHSTGVGNGNPTNYLLLKAIAELNLLRPDFVILLGDLVESNADTYDRDFKQMWRILDEYAEFPVYTVMGNHDGQRVGQTSGFEYWHTYFGPLYYSFDWGDWHFAMVNTYDHPAHPSDNGTIGPAQLDWLEKDLRLASSEKKHIVMALHHNPCDERWIFMDEGRPALKRLIEHYGVKYVFAGHRHTDQLEETETTKIITTRTAQAAAETGVGYRLVEVNQGTITSFNYSEPKSSQTTGLLKTYLSPGEADESSSLPFSTFLVSASYRDALSGKIVFANQGFGDSVLHARFVLPRRTPGQRETSDRQMGGQTAVEELGGMHIVVDEDRVSVWQVVLTSRSIVYYLELRPQRRSSLKVEVSLPPVSPEG